jgi:hypothetical protein
MGMRWEDTAPRQALNLGAAFGIPDDPTLFRVCILRVSEADPLPPAFAEFWRRVLAEGPGECSARWEVLLFQMNLLGGGFTCAFTDRDLQRDEPPVFKFCSAALERECYALPEREPGDPRAEAEYRALEGRCLDHLRDATRAEPAAQLIRALRERREFAVEVCDFYRTRRWPLGL